MCSYRIGIGGRELWFVSWLLRVLRRAIKSKRPGMLPGGINLLHDNAKSANLLRDNFQRFGWKTLQHPPYSPDLSPRDFDIFGDLKKDIRGRRVASSGLF